MELPEPKWAVPGILPEGLNILGGKPKKGKSILALNLCLDVAAGRPALEKIAVQQGTVIYLALEDTKRRLQDRLETMLDGEQPPDRLILCIESPRMNAGLTQLEEEMKLHSDLRLVVIDTFAKFRPVESNKLSYATDYQHVAALKTLADKYSVCILLIHHLTKNNEAEDIMDTFSGTFGLTGAADNLLALTAGEGNLFATLHTEGRDVERRDYSLRFESETLRWTLAGDVQETRSTPKQQRLYDAIKEANSAISPKEIAEKLGFREQYVKNTLPKLLKAGVIRKMDWGKYEYVTPVIM
jgi:RecA-family ATPase/DNA-binding CsgD family transcriptional regulator